MSTRPKRIGITCQISCSIPCTHLVHQYESRIRYCSLQLCPYTLFKPISMKFGNEEKSYSRFAEFSPPPLSILTLHPLFIYLRQFFVIFLREFRESLQGMFEYFIVISSKLERSWRNLFQQVPVRLRLFNSSNCKSK